VNRKEKKIVKLTTASHSMVHLYEGVLPPLIPLVINEFKTDYFHIGIIVTIFSYIFGLGSIPAGLLADKIGSRVLITIFLFGSGIFALFVLPVYSLFAYGLIMGFIGMFCSIYHPASNTLIACEVRQKGKVFGIHGIAGSFGVAAAPMLSACIGSILGWKAPHVLFGIIGIGIGIFSLTIPNKRAIESSPISKDVADNNISYKNLIIFFLSATGLGMTYKGIMTFLPVYMGQNVHLVGSEKVFIYQNILANILLI